MVKPLTFKGDKPKKHTKKRKLEDSDNIVTDDPPSSAPGNPSSGGADVNDTWISLDRVSHLSGPTLIVLPTDPPTALATDANGKVFAAKLENMIEGDPGTAEPHDVRTVWIVQRIPGTNTPMSSASKKARVQASGTSSGALVKQEVGDNNPESVEYSFKSCYGNYLGVDEHSGLRATSIAVSKAETFTLSNIQSSLTTDGSNYHSDRHFVLQTSSPSSSSTPNDTSDSPRLTPGYLSAPQKAPSAPETITLRSDGRSPSSTTTTTTHLILRMQSAHHPTTLALSTQKTTDKEKISRSELEKEVGRKLDDDEVRRLKKAYRRGDLREEMLGLRVKSGRDKYAY